MQEYKSRYEKLLTDAADCELIGGLAADAAKRASFRRLALRLRALAAELKADMDSGSAAERPLTDREFLLLHAQECRDLASASSEDQIRTELVRMAEELEQKASCEQ